MNESDLAELALAVSDGAAIDWEQVVEQAEGPHQRDVIRRLRALANVAAVHHSTAGTAATVDRIADSAPRERGRYALTRLHARGGLGQIWVAHDAELGREIALKELRPDRLGHPSAETRFLEEARITGRLEHPGIVPVHELVRGAGSDSPFYTMRLIHGRTLTEAARARLGEPTGSGSVALIALLQAFVAVCNTIAYANSRGVIHRDLKGENVMVGEFGEVVILDWGVAKVVGGVRGPGAGSTDSPSDDAALTTEGQVIGTPAFMAPEQAEGRLDRIDARTDVYGLGAILYEILTGQPPFSGARSSEVLRKVVHEAPLPPRRLRPGTPPELEAICVRALAKRREDRYPSALDLAHDVQRWLADEPVSAHPESAVRRLSRWARRHKPLVAGTVALLVTALIATSVGLVVLGSKQREVVRQRNAAKQAEAKATAVSGFLIDDMLGAAKPEQALGRKMTVEEVLEAASAKVDAGALATQPEVEPHIRLTIGDAWRKLGLYDRAELQMRKALELLETQLGAEHPDTLTVAHELAGTLQDAGRPVEAAALFRRVVESRRRVLGPTHLETLAAVANLGTALQYEGRVEEAEPLLREAYAGYRQVLGDDGAETLVVANALGLVLQRRGKWAEAEELLTRAYDGSRRVLGEDHPMTLNAGNNLATLEQNRLQLDAAEPLLRSTLAARQRVQGPEHPDTLIAMHNLGTLLRDRGDLRGAAALLGETLEIAERTLGPSHTTTAYLENTLGSVLLLEGKFDEAGRSYRRALEIRRRVLAPQSPDIAVSLLGLGLALAQEGRPADAEAPLREALAIRSAAAEPKPWRTAPVESALGFCFLARKRYDAAEPLLLAGYRTLRDTDGPLVPQRQMARGWIIRLYEETGRPTEALAWSAPRR